MNKRELIKALFKNPTIKALYESGQFNASDINRAILTEALDTKTMERESNELIAQIKAKSKEATDNTKELEADATQALRATAVAANKMGNNPAKKSTLADLAAAQKALRARGAKLPQSKQAAQAAVKTDPSSDDKISAQQLDNLGQNAEKADLEVDQIMRNGVDANTAAQVAQQLKKDLVPQNDDLDDDPQKVVDAVKAAQQGGEGDKTDKIQEYVKFFDDKVDQKAQDKFNQVLGIQPNESDTPANLIAKAFAAYYLMETGTLNEAEGDLPEYETHAKKFVTEMEFDSQQTQTLEDILNNQAFHDAVAAVRDSIKTSGEDTAGDEGDTKTASLDQWLSDKPEDIQRFVNSNELFKTNLAKAYGEAVGAKPGDEGETQQTTANPPAQPADAKQQTNQKPAAKQQTDQKPAAQPAAAQPQPDAKKSSPKPKARQVTMSADARQIQAAAAKKNLEKNKRARERAGVDESLLEGIYLINEQEGQEQEGGGTDQQGAPVEVDDVRTMLTQLQELFKQDNIDINVEEIWTASQESSENIDQQESEALKQKADVNQDKDLSSMEQEELDESWKSDLDAFFGKSAESASFMNQSLLRSQSNLLYSMIKTLDQIIVGNRKPKTGGGVEAAAYTDVGDEEENNQPANPPGKRDDTLEEQIVNEIFDSLFGGKKDKDETVQLSRQSTKNMRQHLEAMVTLLRSLKADINDYSQFSTRESADPRFDGSSLKKAMDAKLAVTQKRIAMLTKQIEISVADQDKQVDTFAEHLTEDKKSERRMKVQKVREVYNRMRELYIMGLMVSLEDGKVKESKRGAQEIKEYVLNEKEFLSYFPQGMIVGTSVMTLSEAHESMSQIIKKFIDTIRDVVTITKSQEVSKEQLEVAAADLVQIADRIESLFKIPSQIDKEFMKKYLKAASQSSKSAPLSDEKPSIMAQAKDAVEKFKSAFGWMSDEVLKLINSFKYDQQPLEQFAKITDNMFGASARDKNNFFTQFVNNADWIGSLDENQKGAVTRFSTALLNEIESIKERQGTKLYLGKLLIKGGLDKKYAVKVFAAFRKISEDDKKILEDLIQNDTEGLAKYLQNFLSVGGKIGKQNSERLAKMLGSIERVKLSPDEEGGDVFPEIDPSKQIGNSEDQMKKLIEVLKQNPSTKSAITKLQTEIKRHFGEDEGSDSDMALYLFVYYVYHQKGSLKENIEVTANPRNKINKFTDYMKKSQFLTKDFKDFISQNVSKISKFLLSTAVKDILNDTDGPVMKILGNLLPKNPDLKRTVNKLNQELETGTGSSKNTDGEDSQFFPDPKDPDVSEFSDARKVEGAEYTEEFREKNKEYIENKKNSFFASKVIKEIFGDITIDNPEKVFAAIIDIAKLVKGLQPDDDELEESISKVLSKIKKSSKSMMSSAKAKAHFAQYFMENERYFGDNYKKAKKPIAFLLEFVDGNLLQIFITNLNTFKGDIETAVKQTKEYRIEASKKLEESLRPIIEKMLKEHYNY